MVRRPGNEAWVRYAFPGGVPAHLERVTVPAVNNIGHQPAHMR